eukprot:1146423-Pelagomonas_calceolata.AAC.4
MSGYVQHWARTKDATCAAATAGPKPDTVCKIRGVSSRAACARVPPLLQPLLAPGLPRPLLPPTVATGRVVRGGVQQDVRPGNHHPHGIDGVCVRVGESGRRRKVAEECSVVRMFVSLLHMVA